MNKEINQETTLMDLINFKSLLFRCLKKWYWFVILLGIAVALTKLNLRYKENVYQVSGSILIKEDQTEQLSTQHLSRTGVSTSVGSKNFIGDQIQILKSKRLMETVIKDLGLYKRYYTVGKIKTNEVYDYHPVIFKEINEPFLFYNNTFIIEGINSKQFNLVINDADTLSGLYGDTISYQNLKFSFDYNHHYDGSLTLEIEDPKYLASSYANNLAIRLLKNTHILALELKDNLPERSVDIIYRLARNYNNYILEFKNNATFRTLDFIDDRLKFITKELYDVESDVEQFKKQNNITLQTDESARHAIDQMYKSDENIASLEIEKQLLIDLRRSIEENTDSYDYLPSSLTSKGGSIASDISEYNRLVNERNRLLIAAKEKNPAVMSMNRQLDLLKKTMLKSIEMTFTDIQSRANFLESKINPVEQSVKDIPKYERRLIQIMRQQKVKEALFTFLLQKREEYSMALASEVNYTRIIDDPIVGLRVSPNAKKAYVLNGIIALCVPAFILLLIELLDKRVYNLQDIKRHTSTPILGSIVREENPGKIEFGADRENNSFSHNEEFRYLRSNLLKYAADNQLNNTEDQGLCIMVTSYNEGEGKTYIAANLSRSIALSGHSCVVINLDFRHVTDITEENKVSGNTGLAGYLQNSLELDNIIESSGAINDLFCIEPGDASPDLVDYFMKDKMKNLFEELRRRFDYILLDTPALGSVADAYSLRNYSDASLFVVKKGHTTIPELDIIEEIHQFDKLPGLSIVFNGTERKKDL